MSGLGRTNRDFIPKRVAATCGLGLALLSIACSFQGSKASDDEQTMEYRKFLSIGRLQAYYHVEPKSGLRYPLVRGTLTNLGSEAVDVVEFNIKFKDALNKVIHQERAYPVFISDFSRMVPQAPLRTGQSTPFAFKFPACPSSWQVGQTEIEITKVILHSSPPPTE